MRVRYITPPVGTTTGPGKPFIVRRIVNVEVPEELVDLALVHPEIDWNEVMRKAVRSYTEPCNTEVV